MPDEEQPKINVEKYQNVIKATDDVIELIREWNALLESETRRFLREFFERNDNA